MNNTKSKWVSCVAIFFITMIGFISLGIRLNNTSKDINLLEEELVNNQAILSSTIDELTKTEEDLLAEIEVSNKLGLFLVMY